MSIVASDIVVYASANMPENDTDTSGGAIDTGVRVTFTDISATDNIEIYCSGGPGDTSQTWQIWGRNAGGSIISETGALNGTGIVTTALQYERVLKFWISATTTGVVTVRKASDDVTIGIVDSGFGTGFRRPFYGAAANAAGGADKDLYEKVFVRNNHASLNLTSATVSGGGNLVSKVDFALSNVQNDTYSVTNRETVPTGTGTALGDAQVNVPGTDLNSTSGIGCWLWLDLNAGDAANNDTYTLRVGGNTT